MALGVVAVRAGDVGLLTDGSSAVPPVRLADAAFRVAVLVGTAHVPDPLDFARLFARANDILEQKTGERMVQTDYLTVGPGDARAAARQYLAARADAPTDGVIVLSEDAESREYGAYSVSVPQPQGIVNRFPSPVEGGGNAYVAVLDLSHQYSRCGYDGGPNRVSSSSRGGECLGRRGLRCVDNGAYWTCPGTTDDLNADHDYFMGCAIVHEFVHPFGALGDADHYGSMQCTARTGMSLEQATNTRLSQESCGMCPDLFPKFKHR